MLLLEDLIVGDVIVFKGTIRESCDCCNCNFIKKNINKKFLISEIQQNYQPGEKYYVKFQDITDKYNYIDVYFNSPVDNNLLKFEVISLAEENKSG